MSGEDIAILTPAEVRQLKERHALVLAENGAPIIAKLRRCIDGKTGRQLLAGKEDVRAKVALDRRRRISPEAREAAALIEAQRSGLVGEHEGPHP